MEDNSAYLIPNSTLCDNKPGCWNKHIETDDERLKRLYLKSETEVAPDEDFQALNQLVFELINTYISGFQIDSRVPYWVREKFEKEMKVFWQRTAHVLSDAYSSALSKGKPTEEALTYAQGELSDRMKLLSSKLALYERQFDTLIALHYYSYDG